MQLEFDLHMNPITKFEIDIECIKKHQDVLRRSFFSKTHAMEKDIEELKVLIENQNREIEILKNIILVFDRKD